MDKGVASEKLFDRRDLDQYMLNHNSVEMAAQVFVEDTGVSPEYAIETMLNTRTRIIQSSPYEIQESWVRCVQWRLLQNTYNYAMNTGSIKEANATLSIMDSLLKNLEQ